MSKTLIAVLVLVSVGMAGVLGANAKPVWVSPYKGAPYVLPEGHANKAATLQKAKPAHIPSRSASYSG